MGLGSILILLMLLVSVLVFGFVVFKSARGWGVLHTLLICTLFIECWVFLVFAAGVQGTRVKFTKEAAVNQERAERAEKETKVKLWGSGDVNSVNIEGVIPAKGELRRLTSDQGRVWRGLSYLQENNGSYELELTGAAAPANDLIDDAPAAAAAPATSESLPANLVVYAFAEEPNEDGKPLPVFYLGEYVVTASQDGLVTLKPTIQLLDVQSKYISSGNAASWTLYELLPVDSHRTFAASGSQSTEEEIFGRMDEEALTELFAGVPEGARRQQLIDTYLRDGKRARDDDPLDSVWIQLNMLKNYEDSVDSLEDANATERGYFDTTGRSIDARLKRGTGGEDGTVQLTPDIKKLIVMKAEAAQELIDNGTAELVQRIFVRPLIDYEQAFNTFVVNMHEVSERSDLIQREIAQLQRANQLGQELISAEQVENQRLNSDLTNYRKELDVLNQAISEATQNLSDLKSEMANLYRDIQSRNYESF